LPPKSYKPSDVVSKYLKKKLHKSKSSKEAALDRRMKVYVLDHIFQSMADLIYFLEQIDTHPILRKSFEKDLEDLLDIRSYNKTDGLPSFGSIRTGAYITQTNFNRFIYASIIPQEKKI